jgi:hypothetical protein
MDTLAELDRRFGAAWEEGQREGRAEEAYDFASSHTWIRGLRGGASNVGNEQKSVKSTTAATIP